MQVIITINKKPGVLDPAAQTIKQSHISLGFDDLENVTMGKQITLSIQTDDQERAKYRAAKMCEALLANAVIEEYKIQVKELS